MAGSIKLAAPLGGSVTLNVVDTATNFVMSVPAAAGILINADSATGAALIPVGTTAQRPASPVAGQLRFNTTLGATEVYNGTAWASLSPYALADYLIVAGGGGSIWGGGGGGGLLSGNTVFARGTTYTVTVGAGGTAGVNANARGGNGGNSSLVTYFGTTTSIGGGGGGDRSGIGTGLSGGSGGGGGLNAGGGSGIFGQGFGGGSGEDNIGNYQVGGGGGGASGAGSSNSGSAAGNGGGGTASSITGSSVTYSQGGGGWGANGGFNGSPTGAGTVNRGRGGGGGGATGGSGIVILKIATSEYSGITTGSPTVTTSGSFTIVQFTSSGSYTA